MLALHLTKLRPNSRGEGIGKAFATELLRRGALIAVRRLEGQRPSILPSPGCRIEDPSGWVALAVVEALHAQCMGSGVFSVNFTSEHSLAKEVTTRMQLKSTKEKTPDPNGT